MKIKKAYKEGYMAILSVMVLFSVIVSVGLILAITSISEGYMTLDSKSSYEAKYYLNSCYEEALLRININKTVPSPIILPVGVTCQVNMESITGPAYELVYTFTISTTYKNFTKSVRVVATRSDKVYINEYREF